MGTGKKRIDYVDYLKIIAMLGVIMSHSLVANVLNDPPLTTKWYILNVILEIISPSVGIFFMVSGALILSSRHSESVGYLFKHRMTKIGIPFLIWSGLSILVFERVDGKITFGIWLHKFLLMYNQYPTPAFWFFYPLLGFYLVSPLVKMFVEKASDKVIDYIIILWFITNIVLPTIANLLPAKYGLFFVAKPDSNLIFIGQAFGYFLIGYRLHRSPIKEGTLHKNVIWMIVLFILAFVIKVVNNVYHINFGIMDYLSIVTLILTAEIFLVVKKWSYKHPISINLQKYTMFLSKLTFGMYLTHGIMMQVVTSKLGITKFILLFPVTTILCLIMTYIISKIPKVRYYLIGID